MGDCEGFTLIDLLVSVSVLGLLMGVLFHFGISGFSISERMQTGFSNETAAGRIMGQIAYGYHQGGNWYPGIAEATDVDFFDAGVAFGSPDRPETISYRRIGSALHRYRIIGGATMTDEILADKVKGFAVVRTANAKLLKVSLGLHGTAQGYQGTDATQYIALRN